MKRVIALAVTACFALGLTACGGQSEKKMETTAETAVENGAKEATTPEATPATQGQQQENAAPAETTPAQQ